MSSIRLNWRDKCFMAIQRASDKAMAAYVMLVMMGVIGVLLLNLDDGELTASKAMPVGLLLIAAVIGTYVIARVALKGQRLALNKSVGQDLSGQNRAELYLWYRYQLKPKDERLQHALEPYVKLLERQPIGILFFVSRTQWWIFFLFAVQLLLHTTNAFSGGDGVLWAATILLIVVAASLYFSQHPEPSQRIHDRLNRRHNQRLQAMRKQL
jgi:protein-S-isoprenylcysteine O-methyltransferase Ste14